MFVKWAAIRCWRLVYTVEYKTSGVSDKLWRRSAKEVLEIKLGGCRNCQSSTPFSHQGQHTARSTNRLFSKSITGRTLYNLSKFSFSLAGILSLLLRWRFRSTYKNLFSDIMLLIRITRKFSSDDQYNLILASLWKPIIIKIPKNARSSAIVKLSVMPLCWAYLFDSSMMIVKSESLKKLQNMAKGDSNSILRFTSQLLTKL